MYRRSILTFGAVLLSTAISFGAVSLIDPPRTGKQFETLSFRFAQNLQFANPFDLVTNRVELDILLPDFTSQTLSFFYDGPGKDSVQRWEARYAPPLPGQYSFTVSVDGEHQAPVIVNVAPNREKNQGGIVLAERRLGAFASRSGEAFRGIGLNVCWADNYEYYFRKMQASGIDVTRIWMCPWNLSFEWQDTGLGRYNLTSAARLDSLLALAAKYGIYVILCMDFHGVAPKGMGYFRENRWTANPYNKANGGPCDRPSDLFTNAEAKEYQKRKYKYIVSRFGHSSQILAWEFFNETDLMAGTSIAENRWHVEMGEYVHAIDVHGRLVSTSSTRSFPEKVVDAFKSQAMDFVMFHQYNTLDFAPYITELHDASTQYYRKPVVLAEFGVEFRGGDRTYKVDSQFVGLHNGIWSGWFSETPVVPMSWWWDSYIDRYDLWREYKALAQFGRLMNFNSDHLAFATVPSGDRQENSPDQPRCMVRCIYSGNECALWFKNDQYQWAMISEGEKPDTIAAFRQRVPDVVPGRYSIRWYNPQTGQFIGVATAVDVGSDRILVLSVPSFSKDLACIVLPRHS